MNNTRIEGRNPVTELLKSDRDIDKILIAKDSTGSITKIRAMASERNIPVQVVERSKLNEICENTTHQGVVAIAAAHNYSTLEDILELAETRGEKPFVVILDGITDPHNLGAILRTANAAGAHGVVIPKRRSSGLNETVAKTSAGAIEYTPVAKVSNLASAIDQLKEKGLWIYGTHQDAKENYTEIDFSGGVGIVIGSEGEGISRIVKEKCDFLIGIPMKGEINSLNASVAAALVMYEVSRGR